MHKWHINLSNWKINVKRSGNSREREKQKINNIKCCVIMLDDTKEIEMKMWSKKQEKKNKKTIFSAFDFRYET